MSIDRLLLIPYFIVGLFDLQRDVDNLLNNFQHGEDFFQDFNNKVQQFKKIVGGEEAGLHLVENEGGGGQDSEESDNSLGAEIEDSVHGGVHGGSNEGGHSGSSRGLGGSGKEEE